MKKTLSPAFFVVILIVFLFSSCNSNSSLSETVTVIPSASLTTTSIGLPSPLPPEPSLTPTVLPTNTATAIILAERIPIIEYHDPTFRLSDQVMMTPDWFEDQMKFLSDHGYQTLSSEQLVDFLNGGAYPQKSVVLSFDIGTDRYKEYADIVIPALRKYGFTAIVFLVSNTNLIGDDCNKGNTFCWSELKNWSYEGLISVESHGIWHLDYNNMDVETKKQDLGISKDVIEQNIGKPVLGFAFPFDAVNAQTNSILKSLGYQFAVGGFTRNDRSMLRWDNDPYNLPRVYPYSNPDIYPRLSSSNGMTFEEMILDQTKLIGLATPTNDGQLISTPTSLGQIVSTPTGSTSTQKPQSAITTSEYMAACLNIDKVSEINLRIYQLNHLDMSVDISIETQTALPIPVTLKPSCNFRPENNPIAIVLHSTRGSLVGTISTFQTADNTSAHYIIDRDGSVIQVLPESLGAYHVSCYGSRANCVDSCPICNDQEGQFIEPALQSIGIELVNGGTVNNPGTFEWPVYEDYSMAFGYRYWDDYPEAQIQSLILLVNDIRTRWNIPLDMVMGHYRINTNTDPGPALNLFWDRYGDPFRKAIFPPQ